MGGKLIVWNHYWLLLTMLNPALYIIFDEVWGMWAFKTGKLKKYNFQIIELTCSTGNVSSFFVWRSQAAKHAVNIVSPAVIKIMIYQFTKKVCSLAISEMYTDIQFNWSSCPVFFQSHTVKRKRALSSYFISFRFVAQRDTFLRHVLSYST